MTANTANTDKSRAGHAAREQPIYGNRWVLLALIAIIAANVLGSLHWLQRNIVLVGHDATRYLETTFSLRRLSDHPYTTDAIPGVHVSPLSHTRALHCFPALRPPLWPHDGWRPVAERGAVGCGRLAHLRSGPHQDIGDHGAVCGAARGHVSHDECDGAAILHGDVFDDHGGPLSVGPLARGGPRSSRLGAHPTARAWALACSSSGPCPSTSLSRWHGSCGKGMSCSNCPAHCGDRTFTSAIYSLPLPSRRRSAYSGSCPTALAPGLPSGRLDSSRLGRTSRCVGLWATSTCSPTQQPGCRARAGAGDCQPLVWTACRFRNPRAGRRCRTQSRSHRDFRHGQPPALSPLHLRTHTWGR